MRYYDMTNIAFSLATDFILSSGGFPETFKILSLIPCFSKEHSFSLVEIIASLGPENNINTQNNRSWGVWSALLSVGSAGP